MERVFNGHSPFYHERRSGEVLNTETACLPGDAIRPERASFKEAGCLSSGARQMGGQERGKYMKITLDKGAKMPTRAHGTDAGLDLYARDTQIIPAKESAVFDTGVHIELPEGTAGFLKSKSGLNTKHGITSEGVIDVGYTGSIVAKLYNHSGTDYKVNAWDKITQLVIVPILTPELKLVESLGETDRGNNGFGSTGK